MFVVSLVRPVCQSMRSELGVVSAVFDLSNVQRALRRASSIIIGPKQQWIKHPKKKKHHTNQKTSSLDPNMFSYLKKHTHTKKKNTRPGRPVLHPWPEPQLKKSKAPRWSCLLLKKRFQKSPLQHVGPSIFPGDRRRTNNKEVSETSKKPPKET